MKQQEVFPTEIYEIIVSHVKDAATHHACSEASRALREICQQQCLLCEAQGSFLFPCKASKPCDGYAREFPQYWSHFDSETRSKADVKLAKKWDRSAEMVVTVGSEVGNRILLPEVTLDYLEVQPPVTNLRAQFGLCQE